MSAAGGACVIRSPSILLITLPSFSPSNPGQYQISNLADVSAQLNKEYGKIVRLGGLVGRPDLLFVYDADEIEKVYRQEGPTPFRPSMPCLVHYKSVVRKEFFGRLAGVVGV